jgi:hypothetical protein
MAAQWKMLADWNNPIPDRIERMLVHGDLLITHYLQAISFWNIKNGLDKPDFLLTLECQDAVNLRIFCNRLYLFAYYAIEVFDIRDSQNIRKTERIEFDRDLIIGNHSMQSNNHVARCGSIMNDKLLFSFFNGIARIEAGSVEMLFEIEYKGFKTERKDLVFQNGHLYLAGRSTGLCNFKVSGNELTLRQTIKKGYTPTSFLLHWDSTILIVFGGPDFITLDHNTNSVRRT